MNQILFFAGLREQAGRESVEMNAAESSIADLKAELAQRFSMEKVKDSMAAINEEFVLDETTIEEGDTIAFIPPVSGG